MLMPAETTTAIAAALCTGCGVGALFASWRRRLRPQPAAVAAGWALVAASVWLWSRFGGVEFGPVLAALNVSLLALLVVLANRKVHGGNGRDQRSARPAMPRAGAVARHLAVFAVTVPLAGAAAILMLVAASAALPWHEVDRLALVLLLVPVLWGAFACWAVSDRQLLRPAVGLTAGASLAAVLAFA